MFTWTKLETELLDLNNEESGDAHFDSDSSLPNSLFEYGWISDSNDPVDTDDIELSDIESRGDVKRISDHKLLTAKQERAVAQALSDSVMHLTSHLCREPCYRSEIIEEIQSSRADLFDKANQSSQHFDAILSMDDLLKLHEWMGTRSSSQLAKRIQIQFEKSIIDLDLDRDYFVNLTEKALSESLIATNWSKQLESVYQLYLNARNTLVEANVRLVYHVARLYRDKGLTIDDIIQEGILGLIRAAQKFDVKTGFRFSTYGYWWIKQSIRQAIAKQRSLIRYPSQLNAQVTQLYAFEQAHINRYGQKPTIQQLEKGIELSAEKIKDLKSLSNFCLSANKEIFNDGVKTLQDDITYGNGQFSLEKNIANMERVERVQQAMAQLTEREFRIVSMRYGIKHRKDYSLNEIAPQIGVSRERVRQITDDALEKLRQLLGDDYSQNI